jgi:hypothetical protein
MGFFSTRSSGKVKLSTPKVKKQEKKKPLTGQVFNVGPHKINKIRRAKKRNQFRERNSKDEFCNNTKSTSKFIEKSFLECTNRNDHELIVYFKGNAKISMPKNSKLFIHKVFYLFIRRKSFSS